MNNLADLAENLIRHIHTLRHTDYQGEEDLFRALASVVEASANVEARRGTISDNERMGIMQRLGDVMAFHPNEGKTRQSGRSVH